VQTNYLSGNDGNNTKVRKKSKGKPELCAMSRNHSARGPMVVRYGIFRECCEDEIITNTKNFYDVIIDGRVHSLISALDGVE
jgi:hypothetical protein